MLPPDPPVDYTLERARGFDVLFRVVWKNGEVSRVTSSMIGAFVPADAVETFDGAYYSHLPGLGPIPSLKQVINGLADTLTFSMSDLSGQLAALFDAEAAQAEGAKINVGRVLYDDRMQPIRFDWLWLGEGGEFRLRHSGGEMQDGELTPATRVVSLEAATQQVSRASAQLYSWTQPQHQIDHPTDFFFEFMILLSQGRVKAWPKF